MLRLAASPQNASVRGARTTVRLVNLAGAAGSWVLRRPDGEAGGHREPHPLTPFLVVDGGRTSYPAAQGTLALGSARAPE